MEIVGLPRRDAKPVDWRGSSRAELRRFPVDARRTAGIELQALQFGMMPTDWKPLPTVGSGAIEVRVHTQGEFRVIVVARFEEAVFVLHAFEKKSRKARRRDIELAASRYRALLAERRSR